MAKANWFYNSRDKKWELRDRAGVNVFEVADGGAVKVKGALTGVTDITVGTLATLRQMQVGGGATVSFITKVTGTLLGLASVGTNTCAVSTLTGMTVAIGDTIFVTPKVAISGGIGIAGAYMPTTNTVNVIVTNPNIASAGSLPHTGVDVTILRLAG